MQLTSKYFVSFKSPSLESAKNNVSNPAPRETICKQGQDKRVFCIIVKVKIK